MHENMKRYEDMSAFFLGREAANLLTRNLTIAELNLKSERDFSVRQKVAMDENRQFWKMGVTPG